MKQLINSFFFNAPFLFALLFSSCDKKLSNGCQLATKEDSIKFARAVLKTYPETQEALKAVFGNKEKYLRSKPIDWEDVKRYAGYYNNNKLLENVRGFMIDEDDTRMMRTLSTYSKFYLRFGKYTDKPDVTDDYTIMIVPITADGNVASRGTGSGRAESNYDELDPCPSECPKDWDQTWENER